MQPPVAGAPSIAVDLADFASRPGAIPTGSSDLGICGWGTTLPGTRRFSASATTSQSDRGRSWEWGSVRRPRGTPS